MCALRDGLDAADSIVSLHLPMVLFRGIMLNVIVISKRNYSSKGALLNDVAHAMMTDNQTSARQGLMM
jgi:hypothetical protein